MYLRDVGVHRRFKYYYHYYFVVSIEKTGNRVSEVSTEIRSWRLQLRYRTENGFLYLDFCSGNFSGRNSPRPIYVILFSMVKPVFKYIGIVSNVELLSSAFAKLF